jgi:hypothetical protein
VSGALRKLDVRNNSIILGYNRVETLEQRLNYILETLGGWHAWNVWVYTTVVGGLVHCYTITWAFPRAFLKAFLWRILRKIEILCRPKTLRIASNIVQIVGFASRKLDGSRKWNDKKHACLAQQHQMVASLPLEGVETNMLLQLESGRSHPGIGTKGVQLYLHTVCIHFPYTVQRIQYT